MTQNVVDFSGNPTGSGLMDDYLDKDQQNVLTSNSGIQRPSYAVAGTKWLDTSANPWVWKMYDGTNDVSLGTVNPSTHLFTPAGVLPSQGGNSGKFLQTDGSKTLWTNAVDYTNITNCITEIPQDIKLELNNGTLTLKAGSKVYVPNGAGKFDIKTTTNDKTVLNAGNAELYVCMFADNSVLWVGYKTGGTVTERPTNPVQYALYYNTTTNVCESYWGNSWHQMSFPIAIVTRGVNGFTSIDQVFNGFGYIGSTVFTLPGVKGLIPNGRNADGSLKNFEIQFTQVTTITNEGSYSGDISITSNYFDLAQGATYNEKDNKNYLPDGVTQYMRCLAGKFVKGTNGAITSLKPKTAFHAVDYNDYAREIDRCAKLDKDNTFNGSNTFAGRNTFTGRTVFSTSDGTSIATKSPVIDSDVTPTSTQFSNFIDGLDINNKLISRVFTGKATDGVNFSGIQAWKGPSNYSITIDSAGNATAPTPATSSNANVIATTAWVNTFLTNKKSEIINWGMPNYSAGVTASWNTDITLPYNSLVVACGNVDRGAVIKLAVDGVDVAGEGLGNGGSDGGRFEISRFVAKGSVIKATGGTSSQLLKHYPLKGV